MTMGVVKLIPGVNVERTPTANEAGVSSCTLIRYRDSLIQKYGGWQRYYTSPVSGVPRALHAWQDLSDFQRLAIGTTDTFYTLTDGVLSAITPQTYQSDFAPDFSTTIGSAVVTIDDPNINTISNYSSVFFNTPVSVGGIILSGLYPVTQSTGPTTYEITAATEATATVASGGAVPVFTTTNNSPTVEVTFNDHGMQTTAPNNIIALSIPTVANGITIEGSYSATIVSTVNDFTITASNSATATGSVDMNGGDAQLLYYLSLGPPPTGAGYGTGGYGTGGYGTGVISPYQTGTTLTATDWTIDNWGEIVCAAPESGGVYYWQPSAGYTTMTIIGTGPCFNHGIFVSTTQQVLIAFASSVTQQIGVSHDPLLVRWCDLGNLFNWTAAVDNQAGSYRIPLGSELRGGMAAPNQNLLWTDLDLWAMVYVGYPDVFSFTNIGAGAGLISKHARQKLRGSVYWMGPSNFYVYSGGGVSVIPCPVWDAVFQNLNTAYVHNIRAMPNTPFNEVGWLYPSAASVDGECDSYVKFNISEPGQPWDYGSMARSAWIDQTVLGMPIASAPNGVLYLQETTNDADGQPLVSNFRTGYFNISPGEEYVFVDMIIPDMRWGTYGGAQSASLQMTFYVTDYPGADVRVHGPYTINSATKYITTRMRGRLMAIEIGSVDSGSFWRQGAVRFRFSAQGRR